MDHSQTVTHLGLCAGYGGIELGLKRAIPSLRTIALCDIEAFAIANLVSKMEAGLMDPAPIWPDLKTFPWESFRDRVDILTGGYPCQPFSAAGQRRGKDDPRHLWPYISDGIRILRPRCCFFENVEGHISLGLSDVIEDLAGMGYRTTWGIFSASECGAPHQRKRVFIMAVASGFRGTPGLSGSFPRDERQPRESDDGGYQAVWPSRPGEQQYAWEPPRVVGNAESRQNNGREPGDLGEEASQGGCSDHAADGAGEELGDTTSAGSWSEGGDIVHQERRSCISGTTSVQENTQRENGAAIPDNQSAGGDGEAVMADTGISGSDGRSDGSSGRIRQPGEVSVDAAGCGSQGNGMRQTQPAMGGDPDGPAGGLDYAQLCVTCDNRTDELRLLGNGVVPATAERAFRSLMRDSYVGDHTPAFMTTTL